MNIFRKCFLCNHYVLPWQKTSATAGRSIHHACHRVSIEISRQNPAMRRHIDSEINDFECMSGRSTDLKDHKLMLHDQTEEHDNEKAEMYCFVKEAEDMVRAFPDQPAHKDHASELRRICEPF